MTRDSLKAAGRKLMGGKYRKAMIAALAVLVLIIGAAQAHGPRPRPQPPRPQPGMGTMYNPQQRMMKPMPNMWQPHRPNMGWPGKGGMAQPIPTITIVAVVEDESVTFETSNYPANQDFTVTMGLFGTRGIGGIEVGTFNSGEGGTFQQTFSIPDELQGQNRIAIRATTDHKYPYFSFNWFWNNTTEATADAAAEAVEAPAEEVVEEPAEGEEAAEAPAEGEEAAEAPAEGEEAAEAPAEGEEAAEAPAEGEEAAEEPAEGEEAAEEPAEGEEGMGGAEEGEQTIAAIATGAGNFNTLLAALRAAGLAETFDDPNAGPFTVFAPTDDAFAALPEGTLESLLADPGGELTDILLYHVAEGEVPSDEIVTMDQVATLLGQPVTVEVTDTGVILNDSVNVVTTDIQASNGIIHVIDAVLLPPDAAQEGAAPAGSNTVLVASTMPLVQAAAPAAQNGNASDVPSFTVCSVERDQTVTILTENFPEGKEFTVQMGPAMQPMRHSMGMWGKHMAPRVWIPYYPAGTIDSTEGGSFETTLEIPSQLAGSYRISIVARTADAFPYMAYNWFYNNTADVCDNNANG